MTTPNIESEHLWKKTNSELLNTCNKYKKCNDNSNVDDCYLKEICNNKIKSKVLKELVLNKNSSDGRFVDSNEIYQNLLLNTINLGIGIVVLSALIVRISK
jgi:hypothetical protein